jgi:hypothetical protein
MDSEESWICIFNEMAMDPAIYPRQECPLVVLQSDETLQGKLDEYVDVLGLDRTRSHIRYNQQTSRIKDNGLEIVDHNYAVSGLDDPSPDNYPADLSISDVNISVESYADANEKARSVFEHFSRRVCEMCDKLAQFGFMPRFVVGVMYRRDDSAEDNGIFVLITAMFVCERYD